MVPSPRLQERLHLETSFICFRRVLEGIRSRTHELYARHYFIGIFFINITNKLSLKAKLLSQGSFKETGSVPKVILSD